MAAMSSSPPFNVSGSEMPSLPSRERLPGHVAIIMDGNGRWARQRNLPRFAGHRAGAKTVRLIVEECARVGLKQLTLYSFSTENWNRPAEEVLPHEPEPGHERVTPPIFATVDA